MDLSNFINTYYRNLTLKHLDKYLDVPAYSGNAGKALVLNKDEDGFIFKKVAFYDFQSDEFEIKNDVVSLSKDYVEKDEANEKFAKVEHTHHKKDIVDFVESDYIHSDKDENIKGIKTFENKVYFKDNVYFEGEKVKVDAKNSFVKDNIITLNENDENLIAEMSGFEVFRGEEEAAKLVWIENEKAFKAGSDDLDKIILSSDLVPLETDIKILDEKIDDIDNKFEEKTSNNSKAIQVNQDSISVANERISDNLTKIESNTSSIKQNSDAIKINADDIKQNSENIKINTNNISINKNEIENIKNSLSIETQEKFKNVIDNKIELKNSVDKSKHLFVYKNGILQDDEEDFILQDDGKTIIFTNINPLDMVTVKYSYKG